jgi:hypothetical protein
MRPPGRPEKRVVGVNASTVWQTIRISIATVLAAWFAYRLPGF